MAQLSVIKTYVKRDFKRTDKDTELVQAYNDMITWVASVFAFGNYKFQSYITTAKGQEDYPIPTNLTHLIHPIRLLFGTASTDSGISLEHITKVEYDLREPNPNRTDPSTGRPSAYTIFSRSILTTPIADKSTYLLEINWAKLPVDLSADSATPDLGAEWDEILKWGTLERLYAGIGMLQEAQYWAGLYRDDEHRPKGNCKRLVDAERDRETPAIGQVKANWL